MLLELRMIFKFCSIPCLPGKCKALYAPSDGRILLRILPHRPPTAEPGIL